MSTGVCRQRMQETEVVDLLCQVGQQVGYHLASLAPWFKFPERPGNVACWTFKRHFRKSRRLLAVQRGQSRLVIECVHMADGPGTIDNQYLLRRYVKVRPAGSVRIVWIDVRPNWLRATDRLRLCRQQPIRIEHSC